MPIFKVALVVGHKRNSGGASSSNGVTEFNYNEELVSMVADNLSELKIEVLIFYRDNYRDLPDEINSKNPDLIISFHCNAFNTKASGSEVLYYHKSIIGKSIADMFKEAICNTLYLRDRGIKGKSTEERGGYLLRYTKAPCVILEPFFIDNRSDFSVGTKFKNELALSIAAVIVKLA